MTKLIVIAIVLLYFIYAAMCLGQLLGIFKFTEKEITLGKLIFVPFYYWFKL